MLPALGGREQIVELSLQTPPYVMEFDRVFPLWPVPATVFATLGSGCERSDRIAITLGTSASVRRIVEHPVLDEGAGTFCYRADEKTFLLGCASNNGGNVLDWGRAVFGRLPAAAADGHDLPVFIPLLNGERSPEWDPTLRASWHGVSSTHTAEHLAQAVVDGVVFNLAHYAAIVERTSGVPTRQAILSGNGFLLPGAVQALAALLECPKCVYRQTRVWRLLRGASALWFTRAGCRRVCGRRRNRFDRSHRSPRECPTGSEGGLIDTCRFVLAR